MKLHDLHTSDGSTHKKRRVGRGDSSGWGRTCGRGEKGQKSRSGAVVRPFFEGGQIPLFRRIPKRGFKSFNRKDYNIVNLSVIESVFDTGAVVDIEALRTKGVVGDNALPLKILAHGDISKSITIKADKFSATAKSKIEAAGGTCEIV
jgi:large subunit ribosomal protein L15